MSTYHPFLFITRQKHLLLCLLLSLRLAGGSHAHASSDTLLNHSKHVLAMKGSIKFLKDPDKKKGSLDSAIIHIINEDSVLVATHYSDKKGNTLFRLPLNRKFTVGISKKGFVTKIFEINTKVPLNKTKDYEFEFDVGIFEEIKGLNVSVLKKPIAKVGFNNFMSIFDYDYNYTGKINREIEQMYQDYYELRQSMNEEEDYRKKKNRK